MSDDATSSTYRDVLSNRRFFALWLAQFVSSFGDWLAILALFSLVAFRLHGSPYQVAGVMISFIAPWALLGPVAGVYVDRWNVKRTMIASDLLRAVIAALLALSGPLGQTYLLVFLLSSVSCFFMPAQAVAIPLIVRREDLLLANSLNAQTIQLGKVISPAIAGLLVSWAGEKACFYIDGATFLFSAATLSKITIDRVSAEAGKDAGSVFKDLVSGIRLIRGHRAISFVMLSMATAIVALGSFDALVSVYIRDLLGRQAGLFGALVSLVGAGTIIGALLMRQAARMLQKVQMVVAAILLMGLCVLAFAALNHIAAVVAASLMLGIAVAYVLVPSQTLIQEESPPGMLGRVSSTSLSLMTLSQLAAFLLAGTIASWIGIRNLYFVVSAALVLVGSFGFLYARAAQISETIPELAGAANGGE